MYREIKGNKVKVKTIPFKSKVESFLKIILWTETQLNNNVTCWKVLKLSIANFIKKETLAEVFSCEFCEIFKKTFFTKQLRWLLLYIRPENVRKSLVFWRFQGVWNWNIDLKLVKKMTKMKLNRRFSTKSFFFNWPYHLLILLHHLRALKKRNYR